MAAFLKVFGGLTVFGTSGLAAYVYQTRQRRIEETRQQLQAQYDTLGRDLAVVNGSISEVKKSIDHVSEDTRERLETMHALWGDRLQRYDMSLARSRDCLDALPEGIQLLSEVQEHCVHLAQLAPKFMEFDVTSSRIHAFAMLAAAVSRSEGVDGVLATDGSRAETSLRKNLDVVKPVVAHDPVANTILNVLHFDVEKNPAANDGPKSYGELSSTFSKSRRYLTEAMNEYNERIEANLKKKAEEEQLARGDYIPFRPGTASQGAKTALSALRLADGAQQPEETPAMTDARLAQEREQELASYVLRDRRDVLNAILHVEHLRQTVAKEKAQWTEDAHVSRALKSLEVWASAAEQFVAEEQATRALKAINLCVERPMVHVWPDAAPPEVPE